MVRYQKGEVLGSLSIRQLLGFRTRRRKKKFLLFWIWYVLTSLDLSRIFPIRMIETVTPNHTENSAGFASFSWFYCQYFQKIAARHHVCRSRSLPQLRIWTDADLRCLGRTRMHRLMQRVDVQTPSQQCQVLSAATSADILVRSIQRPTQERCRFGV